MSCTNEMTKFIPFIMVEMDHLLVPGAIIMWCTATGSLVESRINRFNKVFVGCDITTVYGEDYFIYIESINQIQISTGESYEDK